jgi:hypothetical protein
MCNSMHIMSKQHWLEVHALQGKAVTQQALQNIGRSAGTWGSRVTAGVKPLMSDSGYLSCRRSTFWYCFFSAHTALDLREGPRANKVPFRSVAGSAPARAFDERTRDSVCPGYLPNTSLAMVANCMLEVPS